MYGVVYIPVAFADDSTANFNMTNNFRYHILSTKPIAISFLNVVENKIKNVVLTLNCKAFILILVKKKKSKTIK